MGVMSGTLDLLQRSYAGSSVRDGVLHFQPRLIDRTPHGSGTRCPRPGRLPRPAHPTTRAQRRRRTARGRWSPKLPRPTATGAPGPAASRTGSGTSRPRPQTRAARRSTRSNPTPRRAAPRKQTGRHPRATPVNRPSPGTSAAGWISGADGDAASLGCRVSGTRAAKIAATSAHSAAPTQTKPKPPHPNRACPTTDRQQPRDRAPMSCSAAPRPARPGRARSANAANPATKNTASATPSRTHRPTSQARSVTSRCSPILTANRPPHRSAAVVVRTGRSSAPRAAAAPTS
jgi:hypothetical protein